MEYYFLLVNVFAFFLFGLDKRKSKRKQYRIPEKVLFLVTFLGGSFGSLFGMFYFHHKNKKKKFLFLVPLSCFLWVLFLIFFL